MKRERRFSLAAVLTSLVLLSVPLLPSLEVRTSRITDPSSRLDSVPVSALENAHEIAKIRIDVSHLNLSLTRTCPTRSILRRTFGTTCPAQQVSDRSSTTRL